MPSMSPEARLQIDFILLSLVLFGVSCFLTVLLDSLQSLSPSLPPSPFEERNTLLIKEGVGEECTGRAAEPRPFSWTGWSSLTFPLRIAKSFLGHLVSLKLTSGNWSQVQRCLAFGAASGLSQVAATVIVPSLPTADLGGSCCLRGSWEARSSRPCTAGWADGKSTRRPEQGG